MNIHPRANPPRAVAGGFLLPAPGVYSNPPDLNLAAPLSAACQGAETGGAVMVPPLLERQMKPYRELQHMAIVHPVLGPNHPDEGGVFALGKLRIIASWVSGWDHVSVSLPDRTPTWDEMERVKRAFFKPEETAYQLHVPPSDHINCHPYCLHLWRHHHSEIPMPPAFMVGPSLRQ